MADLPDHIDGYGPVHAFAGAVLSLTQPNSPRARVNTRFTATLPDAIRNAGLTSGGTISFHHHLRNGDDVMRQVLDACKDLGIGDLHIAPSSLFPCHASLIPYLEDKTVTRITTSYMNGPLANAVKAGRLQGLAVLQSHGGRAYAIESGRLEIDVAFVAAPAVDNAGNLTGATGPEACGPLGYAMVDAAYAAHVVAITDHKTDKLPRICIPATRVDQVVPVPSIGASAEIVSGTTGRFPSANGHRIAGFATRLIASSGLLKDDFSFQTGAGATSLAVAQALAPVMAEQGITGSFAAGGITGPLVHMHRQGLFRQLWNVQAFDLEAVQSYAVDPEHHAMSASKYASPARADAMANRLDVMILGAAEVDTWFNVNVTQASDGRIIGGSGGHADTAAEARLPIVTTTLTAGGFPKLVSELNCKTTPGANIGAIVTEVGVAVHPSRPDLARDARQAGLPVMSVEGLHHLAQQMSPGAKQVRGRGRIVVVCEYRDGTVIDVIRA